MPKADPIMPTTTPQPGAGWRLLLPTEVIKDGDSWCFCPPGIAPWWSGTTDKRDIGKLLGVVRISHSGTYDPTLWYRTPDLDATTARCGCGHHDINPKADPHVQHREWVEDQHHERT